MEEWFRRKGYLKSGELLEVAEVGGENWIVKPSAELNLDED